MPRDRFLMVLNIDSRVQPWHLSFVSFWEISRLIHADIIDVASLFFNLPFGLSLFSE
jgi:hypothetical protein